MNPETINTIASIVGILGLYQLIISLWRFYHRPKVYVGVFPREEIETGRLKIEDIGQRCGHDEIIFKNDFFAKKSNNNCPSIIEKKFPETTRVLARKSNNTYDIPIIINNKGLSTLKDYKLNVTFTEHLQNRVARDTRLKLADVHTETAVIDGLFADTDIYFGKNAERIPSKEIQNTWAAIGLSANFVTFRGELGSGIYEMLFIRIVIPLDIYKIALFFEIDPRGTVPKSKRYCQLIEIIDLKDNLPASGHGEKACRP